jgi:HAD superfamily hydrolase (TIGR01549 family)
MSKVLFLDYDETLHDTKAKFAIKLDGIYGLNAGDLMDAYLIVHRGIVHIQYPEKHDDFFFLQRLLAEHLGKPYDKDEALKMARRFKEAQEECWTNPTFFPETFHFLDRVKERHILCLTTGDYAMEKANALEKAGGRSYFSYAFDHTHLGLKGSSDYFLNALMSTNSQPQDVIAIGDSLEHDIATAQEAGIKTIWVNRRGQLPLDNSPSPDYQATDLFEVLKFLENY